MCKRALALFAVFACLAPVGAASAAVQGTTLLLGRSDGLGPLPAAGDNTAQATQRALSGDGRFVVFRAGGRPRRPRRLPARLAARHPDGHDDADRPQPGRRARERELVRREHQPRRDGGLLQLHGEQPRGGGRPGQSTGFITRGHVYVVRFASGSLFVADRASGAEGAIGDGGADDCLIDSDGSRVAFDSDSRTSSPETRTPTPTSSCATSRRRRRRGERHRARRGHAGGGRRRARVAVRRRHADRLGHARVAARGRHEHQRVRHLRSRHVRGNDVPRQPGDRQRLRRRRLVRARRFPTTRPSSPSSPSRRTSRSAMGTSRPTSSCASSAPTRRCSSAALRPPAARSATGARPRP